MHMQGQAPTLQMACFKHQRAFHGSLLLATQIAQSILRTTIADAWAWSPSSAASSSLSSKLKPTFPPPLPPAAASPSRLLPASSSASSWAGASGNNDFVKMWQAPWNGTHVEALSAKGKLPSCVWDTCRCQHAVSHVHVAANVLWSKHHARTYHWIPIRLDNCCFTGHAIAT